MITIEELNEVLNHAKNRKSCGLDNLPMELWIFGGNELKIHLLELFNNIIDKNQMPQEWETGRVINIHKKGTKRLFLSHSRGAEVENFDFINVKCTSRQIVALVPANIGYV